MDNDRIAGAAQKLGGGAKDAVGGAFGDTKLQAEGKADKAAGTVRNAVGGAKDAARDLGDDVQGELARLHGQVSRLMDETSRRRWPAPLVPSRVTRGRPRTSSRNNPSGRPPSSRSGRCWQWGWGWRPGTWSGG